MKEEFMVCCVSFLVSNPNENERQLGVARGCFGGIEKGLFGALRNQRLHSEDRED